MKKLLQCVGVGACALSLVAVAGVALAQSNSSIDDVGGSIFDSVSLDLKVNGQDGPVTIQAGSRIVVSWISEGASRCRGNWSRSDIKSSGTVAGRLSRSVVIKAACIDREGNRDDDSVVVNVEGKAQIETPVISQSQNTSSVIAEWKTQIDERFRLSATALIQKITKDAQDFKVPMRDAADPDAYERSTTALLDYLKAELNKTSAELLKTLQDTQTEVEFNKLDKNLGDRIDSLGQEVRARLNLIKQKYTSTPTTFAPTSNTSGNVGTGNVGVTTTTTPPSLSATAPTIAGTRTAAGDKLYPGSMSITATISNSGGALTTPVSARFQFSTNNGANWYDWVEVGPISTVPRNVTHSWEGGVGTFSLRLCIGGGTDNCSPSSSLEIVPKEGAFLGLSRELAAAGVPDNDVWAFVKRWLGR